jgi:choline dehydrogenase
MLMGNAIDTIEADIVIVGAGLAGCTLAGRLSEDSGTSATLLEAYETERGAYIAGRPMYWARGKVLGGSSSVNAARKVLK